MNRQQQEKCAARLQVGDRGDFLRMHHRAAHLIQQGVEMRREAWELYRRCTGLPLGEGRQKETKN